MFPGEKTLGLFLVMVLFCFLSQIFVLVEVQCIISSMSTSVNCNLLILYKKFRVTKLEATEEKSQYSTPFIF